MIDKRAVYPTDAAAKALLSALDSARKKGPPPAPEISASQLIAMYAADITALTAEGWKASQIAEHLSDALSRADPPILIAPTTILAVLRKEEKKMAAEKRREAAAEREKDGGKSGKLPANKAQPSNSSTSAILSHQQASGS